MIFHRYCKKIYYKKSEFLNIQLYHSGIKNAGLSYHKNIVRLASNLYVKFFINETKLNELLYFIFYTSINSLIHLIFYETDLSIIDFLLYKSSKFIILKQIFRK